MLLGRLTPPARRRAIAPTYTAGRRAAGVDRNRVETLKLS